MDIVDDGSADLPEEVSGESLSGLAVGTLGEVQMRESDQFANGDVAFEDLSEEEGSSCFGIECTIARIPVDRWRFQAIQELVGKKAW